MQGFCSLSYHMWDGYWLLANQEVFKGLPSGFRDIIEHEFDLAAQDERNDLARADPHLRGDLAETGMKFNPVDTGPFRDALRKAGFYTDWRLKFGDVPWGLLEDYVGPLA